MWGEALWKFTDPYFLAKRTLQLASWWCGVRRLTRCWCYSKFGWLDRQPLLERRRLCSRFECWVNDDKSCKNLINVMLLQFNNICIWILNRSGKILFSPSINENLEAQHFRSQQSMGCECIWAGISRIGKFLCYSLLRLSHRQSKKFVSIQLSFIRHESFLSPQRLRISCSERRMRWRR